ncbi:MAG: hypothetical protein ABIH39_05065 [Candidatus Margulisiibacteriota bacterium]
MTINGSTPNNSISDNRRDFINDISKQTEKEQKQGINRFRSETLDNLLSGMKPAARFTLAKNLGYQNMDVNNDFTIDNKELAGLFKELNSLVGGTKIGMSLNPFTSHSRQAAKANLSEPPIDEVVSQHEKAGVLGPSEAERNRLASNKYMQELIVKHDKKQAPRLLEQVQNAIDNADEIKINKIGNTFRIKIKTGDNKYELYSSTKDNEIYDDQKMIRNTHFSHEQTKKLVDLATVKHNELNAPAATAASESEPRPERNITIDASGHLWKAYEKGNSEPIRQGNRQAIWNWISDKGYDSNLLNWKTK